MPQPTQHALIHVIMLWITILSIVQILVIVLFFTVGHQNSSAVTSELQKQTKPSNAPPSSKPGLLPGKMITYQATALENTKIKWLSKISDPNLIFEQNESKLKIVKDGYFLILLQVTLSYDNNASRGSQHTVSLKADNNKVILQGVINNNTCSTGLLGKVEMLAAESSLEVTVNPTLTDNTVNYTLTHLDIVYMPPVQP